MEAHPAYVADVNLPGLPAPDDGLPDLMAAPPDMIVAFLDALDSVMVAELDAGRASLIYDEPETLPSLVDDDITGAQVKHVRQVAAIVGHVARDGMLDTDHLYVEPGAGKGSLVDGLGRALGVFSRSVFSKVSAGGAGPSTTSSDVGDEHADRPPLFVLLEREKRRWVAERGMRRSLALRVRIDIKDADLAALPDVDPTAPRVMVAKHLCGGATDLALYMATRTETLRDSFEAVYIAQCCYGKVSADTFVGMPFLAQRGLARYFSWIRRCSEWAISIEGASLDAPSLADWLASNARTSWRARCSVADDHLTVDDLPASLRVAIGYKARTLIELARAWYLESQGFITRRVEYVPLCVTPQNVLLVGLRPRPT
ncbi:coiled-coil domain-containing protein 76 [Thecamonas trahens ATCC 50062]|uniref:tRNA:m(4)X modification enzyme TRM13 n=1 Tax=Thecamonas trahens ATCC 50062 TaxID=461836 RepID=A0A0L0D6C9_THETB|nr:coiled-coil domain-containing protein 76 [Thecamonas trahens ATCC 50062]KNC47909.1 coiled-coil domain-containing protein 76 [Thecamonas trahens ATCC 50062]|eukprot:XP_013758930.1 coiled-coil domain-containing protein 76 [Thecamonas trahens ATCC 50062]